jgi:BON domain
MANDYRRDRGGPNRGMFGYEGEGFMRGADYDDYARRGYGRGGGDEITTGFSGSYGGGAPSGYRDLESGSDRGWNIGRSSDRGDMRPSYRGRGPKNYNRSDDRIREDVCERLTMDHDVDASEIEVNVNDGVVTLTGTVHERHAKRVAEDLCESIPGVKDVQNQLRVAR